MMVRIAIDGGGMWDFSDEVVDAVAAASEGDSATLMGLPIIWPEPGAVYSTDPKKSPFVTLAPRDEPQADEPAIVQGSVIDWRCETNGEGDQ